MIHGGSPHTWWAIIAPIRDAEMQHTPSNLLTTE